ncbi:MAG: hypothetical protein ACLUD2_01205 [Clostridium sp.]
MQCGSIATKAEAAQRKREPLQTGGVTRDREMKFLSITGPKDDIDQVVDQYL